jgi:signal transduction histidine kinase
MEKMKLQWELAADSMPQLVCVLDRHGHVLRANRTVERWKLRSVAGARGLSLHELLHEKCASPQCGLRVFWRSALQQLREGRRVKHECWDPELQRHLSILLQPPVYPARPETGEELLGIATVEDISEIHAHEEQRVRSALSKARRELQRMSAQHLDVRESERRRVAMDLHDGLGQSLNLLKLSIQETARLIGTRHENDPGHAVYQLASRVEAIMGEVRRIAMDLRPSTLDDLGLVATLSWFFRDFESRCSQPRVERAIKLAEADVPEALKLPIYRILQEAMTNAMRHAAAELVTVVVRKDEEGLHLSVTDNGCGFDRHAGTGLGLQSMKERAEAHGAVFSVHSAPGDGTRIGVTWRSVGADQASRAKAAKQPQCTACGSVPLRDDLVVTTSKGAAGTAAAQRAKPKKARGRKRYGAAAGGGTMSESALGGNAPSPQLAKRLEDDPR